MSWHKQNRRWLAQYTDANGKRHSIGLFDTQEQAAHAVNAAIRRAGLEGRRKTNPVVDGQLVPRERTKKANGHGPKALRKRRREEPAAAAGKWNEHDVERELNNQEYRKKIQARIAEIERENAEREAAAARHD